MARSFGTRISFAAAVFVSLAAQAEIASGQTFPANHLFVADLFGARVLEFDESGAFVRAITTAPGTNSPTGLAFGPDGLLYVGTSADDQLLRFDGSGAIVDSITHPSILQVEAVELDTFGRPLVTTFLSGDLVRLALDGSSATMLHDDAAFLVDLEIDANGWIATSDTNDGFVRLFDVDATEMGTTEDSHADVVPAVAPRGIAFQRLGKVDSGDGTGERILLGCDRFGGDPDVLAVPQAPIHVEDIDYGPDGRLYAATANSGTVVAADTASQTVMPFAQAPDGNPYLIYMAFAPFRFDAVVKGHARDSNGSLVTIAEKAVVSIQPASRCVMLLFVDDPDDATDFVSVTGHDRFVTFGVANAFDAPGPMRSIHARAPRSASDPEDVTVFCEWKRKLDAHGFERVLHARGSLWCGDADALIHLTFKTNGLVNP